MKIVNGLLPDDKRVPVNPVKRIPKRKPFETTYPHRFPDGVERVVMHLGIVHVKSKKKDLPVFQLDTDVQAAREVFKQNIAQLYDALATGEIEKLAAVAPAKMQLFGVQPWPKDKASRSPRAACLKPSAMIVIPSEPRQQAPEAFTLASYKMMIGPGPKFYEGKAVLILAGDSGRKPVSIDVWLYRDLVVEAEHLLKEYEVAVIHSGGGSGVADARGGATGAGSQPPAADRPHYVSELMTPSDDKKFLEKDANNVVDSDSENEAEGDDTGNRNNQSQDDTGSEDEEEEGRK